MEMSDPDQSSHGIPMEVSSGQAVTPVVLIRPQTVGPPAIQQIRPSTVGGRVINIGPSMASPSVGRPGVLSPSSGMGGNAGGGGFVIRGNQLVRLPGRPGESPAAAGSKSPLKVHLVSATGMVKQQPLAPGAGIRSQGIAGKPGAPAGMDQTGDKAKSQQYQVLMPSAQNSQQVVLVNAGGAAKQSRIAGPPKPGTPGAKGDSQVVYLGAGSVGASATVGEGTVQVLSSSGFKKSRPIGIPGTRKPCNCTKSQCLKLYCECFANGEFCRNCNCNNCHNNLAYENERSKSIKMCLERNPYAFQPKIGKGFGKGRQDADRLHNKGCNCKKSSCLKNYCECYEAKVPCTHRCKCVGCRNTEGDRIHKYRGAGGLHSLANAASFISGGHRDHSTRADSPATEASYDKPDPKRMPWYYMTDDVVEATAFCLLAKAEQLESKETYDEVDCQREILKEFGRCLEQIISSAAE